MDLDLGKHVKTSDGRDVGKVDRLIIKPETHEIHGFVVHEGHLLTRDVIVELDDVDNVDADGVVHLKLTEAQTNELNAFEQEKYYVPSSEQYHAFSSQGWAGSTVTDPMSFGGSEYSDGQPHLIHPSSFSADDVILTEGTDIYDSEGARLGSLDEIVYTPNGLVTGLLVRGGHFHHHDVQVPIDAVSMMTHERIHLRVNAASLASAEPKT